uniref:Zinc finger AN1-type containing 2A n=1 Tax=Myotis myotis TaxID=51298 RepID=A0A7J7XLM7_MYOMY|nr:zinc finger AN1-type containing 2A [Myotis myotis]
MWWLVSTWTEIVDAVLGRRRRFLPSGARKRGVRRKRCCRWLVTSVMATSVFNTDTLWIIAAHTGAEPSASGGEKSQPGCWPDASPDEGRASFPPVEGGEQPGALFSVKWWMQEFA